MGIQDVQAVYCQNHQVMLCELSWCLMVRSLCFGMAEHPSESGKDAGHSVYLGNFQKVTINGFLYSLDSTFLLEVVCTQ